MKNSLRNQMRFSSGCSRPLRPGEIFFQVALLVMLITSGSVANHVHAADAWFSVPIDKLEITAGQLKSPPRQYGIWGSLGRRGFHPRVVLDGPGEGLVGRKVGQPYFFGKYTEHPESSIVVRAESGRDVTGRLFFPKSDWQGMDFVRFRIPADQAQLQHRSDFLKVQQFHYEWLQRRRLPGNAWFRHRTREIAQLRGVPQETHGQPRMTFTTGEFYTGTRAISENLALDRLLDKPKLEPLTIDPHSLPGVTIKEFDWDKMTPDNKPVIDPLAKFLPHDQYAVFFHDFGRFMALIDEVAKNGIPFAESVSPSIQDNRTLKRYETQLCLSLGQAQRLLGPQVVKSVAITGSDLYLRDGSEVAVLFETPLPKVLQASIVAQQNLVLESTKDCERRSGTSGDLRWTGIVSPNDHISSWVVQADGVVLVTNSRQQIERFAGLQTGTEKSLAALGEYRHFRGRYQRDDAAETAFLMLTDATIRHWCSAAERIALTRRVHAGAMLAELTATHMDELVKGVTTPRALSSNFSIPEQGRLRLTADGVVDSRYGSLKHLTPVSQLEPHLVSKGEAKSYAEWVRNFQRNFRRNFDPIGVRLSLGNESLGMDMTVMPLQVNSSYAWLTRSIKQNRITPDAGDRHAENIFNFTAPASSFFSTIRFLVNDFDQELNASIGQTMSFYLDDSPIWRAFMENANDASVLIKNAGKIPAALRFDLVDPAAFPGLVNGIVKKASDNESVFHPHQYRGVTFYRLKSEDHVLGDVGNLLSYVVLPDDDEVHFSLNEQMIHAAIDRHLDRQKIRKSGQPVPVHGPAWLGESVGIQMRWPVGIHDLLIQSRAHNLAARSWENLHILNEWKKKYPTEDAVALHARVWNQRLVCPGGGAYSWNAEYQTYESSVFGHPAQPKFPDDVKGDRWIDRMQRGNFGLNVEEHGLRAIMLSGFHS